MTEHYFTTPTGAEQRREIPARIWGRDYTFTSAAGVFSGTRLDPGTAVLFDKTAPLLKGLDPTPAHPRTLLDLGCGYGPIAVALATERPSAQVYAVDVNERALELARINAAAAAVAERVHVSTPDSVPPAATFDEIWSNPPIRIGKQALHELLLTWLPRLNPTGTAYLVVGKNLGADSLQNWLIEQGYPTDRLGSAKGFRVLVVKRR
ncbi:MAG: methyltransferase [Propionibacteriaceae bacterium]|jgi:16S rRNA G1207 methylase RsmC|nr:methyltransferase [Propionibacteriaceae bacterium]